MKLGASDSISPDVHARLACLALACLGPGQWYCVPEAETAAAIRSVGPAARFTPSVDTSRPRQKGPRPWLVLAYSAREGSPVALARPGSSTTDHGPVIGSHVGRHGPEEAATCKLIKERTRLSLGAPIPLPVVVLPPERYSCREPDFRRLRAASRAWVLDRLPSGDW